MKFAPKSTAEVEASQAAFKPFKSGTYDFEIFEATDEISRAGNEMIKLNVEIYDDAGNKRRCFDYLMESISYKLRHCADACGLTMEYESGELRADDFQGKTGRCKVRYVPEKDGYKEKNEISDYVVLKGTAQPATTRSAPQQERAPDWVDSDTIPF